MAAPDLKLRTLTGTGANSSTRECEWKQGESAKGEEKPSLEKEDARTLWRLPLVGDPQWWAARRRIIVDTERPSHGSRDREGVVGKWPPGLFAPLSERHVVAQGHASFSGDLRPFVDVPNRGPNFKSTSPAQPQQYPPPISRTRSETNRRAVCRKSFPSHTSSQCATQIPRNSAVSRAGGRQDQSSR